MGAPLWNIEKVVKKGDYLYAVVKEHPRASKHGYVLFHRIIMENHLGRLLEGYEVVHHKDGNKKNNKLSNLELTTISAHCRKHGLNQGHMIAVLKCPSCKKIFERRKNQTHLNKGGVFTACSNKCRGSFSRSIQLYGKTQWVEDAVSGNIVRIEKRFPTTPRKPIPGDP